MAGFRVLDGMAVSLSAACLLHCLALPLLVTVLPALSLMVEAEWLHWMFVGVAAPTSILALRRLPTTYTGVGIVLTAIVGLALLAAGAAGLGGEAGEVLLTVAGGLLLAGVHITNWRRHRACGLATEKASGG